MSIGVNPGLKDIAQSQDRKRNVAAAGGVLGAVLASSCCIGPLLLIMLGASGAWIGNLTALAPYQWLFIIATVGLLGAGFWTVYFKPKATCEEGSYCATPTSDRVVKTVLWIGAVLVIAAVAVNVLTPLLL